MKCKNKKIYNLFKTFLKLLIIKKNSHKIGERVLFLLSHSNLATEVGKFHGNEMPLDWHG